MFHDVGKANLGFQLKVFDKQAIQAGHIKELAPLLDFEAWDEDLNEAFIQALPQELATWFPDGSAAYSYLLASLSHHGKPLRFRGEKRHLFRGKKQMVAPSRPMGSDDRH